MRKNNGNTSFGEGYQPKGSKVSPNRAARQHAQPIQQRDEKSAEPTANYSFWRHFQFRIVFKQKVDHAQRFTCLRLNQSG